MTDGFWAFGPGAYEDGLMEHYDSVLANLRDRLDSCTNDGERERLETEIADANAEYENKHTAIDGHLF